MDTSHSDTLLAFSDVARRFGDKIALDGLSFSLNCGRILAIVGPNGAGKTTSIRLLLGLLRCSSGTVSFLGHESYSMPDAVRAKIGVLLENPGLYGEMSSRRNLLYFGQLCGMSADHAESRMKQLLSTIGFDESVDTLVSLLSKGSRQKVALARAMLHAPSLLVLDEPTSGLDPLSQRDVRKMVLALAGTSNTAVLITSHNMPEVAQLADEVLLLKRGRAIAWAPPEKLISAQGRIIELAVPAHVSSTDIALLLRQSGLCRRVDEVPPSRVIAYANLNGNAAAVATLLENSHIDGLGLSERSPTLEEVYYLLMEE